MVFVDTSFWVALFDRSESGHRHADRLWRSDRTPVLTSDYVLDETVTVLKARIGHRGAVASGQALLSSPRVSIESVDASDQREAWRVFRTQGDKVWSFTDCTSKVLIDRLSCEQVWALDIDFRQMGYQVRP